MHNSKLLQQQQINENMKEEWLWNTKTFYAWEFLQKNKKSKKKQYVRHTITSTLV